MLNLLLSMGANPNIVYDEHENVLWDLQYNGGETIAENENRLNMARCLLENGANPKVVVEGEDTMFFLARKMIWVIWQNIGRDFWIYWKSLLTTKFPLLQSVSKNAVRQDGILLLHSECENAMLKEKGASL